MRDTPVRERRLMRDQHRPSTPGSLIAERARRLAKGEHPELAGAVLIATTLAEGFALLARAVQGLQLQREADAARAQQERTSGAPPQPLVMIGDPTPTSTPDE